MFTTVKTHIASEFLRRVHEDEVVIECAELLRPL